MADTPEKTNRDRKQPESAPAMVNPGIAQDLANLMVVLQNDGDIQNAGIVYGLIVRVGELKADVARLLNHRDRRIKGLATKIQSLL